MDIRPDLPTILADRLGEAVRRSGLGKGAFAELAGVDRTTLAQLLSRRNHRLPRVDTIMAIATAHRLSVDWLVGLSNVGPVEAELLHQETSFERPGPTLITVPE